MAPRTTHDTGHMTLHTPDKNLVLGKREGGKGYHSGGVQEETVPTSTRDYFDALYLVCHSL